MLGEQCQLHPGSDSRSLSPRSRVWHILLHPAPRTAARTFFRSDAAAGPLEYTRGGHSERWHIWRLPLLGLQGVAGLDTAGTGGRGGRATLGLAELSLQPAQVCKSLREKTLPLDPATFTHQRVSGCHCMADRCSLHPHSVGSQGPWGPAGSVFHREASNPASGRRSL